MKTFIREKMVDGKAGILSPNLTQEPPCMGIVMARAIKKYKNCLP